MHYFYYYQLRHGGDFIKVLLREEYDILLKGETVYEPVFSANLNPTKSYLFELPLLADIDRIQYGKQVDASEYNIKMHEVPSIYQKYNFLEVAEKSEQLLDDVEWKNWLSEYDSTHGNVTSPQWNYLPNKVYCLILSNGNEIVTYFTNTFNCEGIKVLK